MEAGLSGLFSPLSCREVSRRVAAGVLDDGAFPERVLIRLHFLICAHCRRFARQVAFIAAAARAIAHGVPDPARQAALEKRLLERLGAS